MSAVLSVHADMQAAFRQRLIALALATTGTITDVSAAGSTLSRASGSFTADGFAEGDEVVVSGFAAAGNNGRAMITQVSALAMVLDKSLAAEAAGAAVTVASGAPQGRAWEGRGYSPVVGQPYLSESLRPIGSPVRALGLGGTIEHRMLGNVVLHYPAGRGTLAVNRMAGAILSQFRPGTALSYGQNNGVVQQAERAPAVQEPDWITVPVTISITAYTAN